ncbi:MAG TPA: PAAR domain-containing protein [Actinomycetes bacterium]|nr:PAAR domain-containing protein [Actinomycetes bacterium]
MGQPAAKQGDRIVAVDTHIVMVQTGPTQTPTPLPHPFAGMISGGLSTNVKIMGKPAAVVGSTADNTPSHIPNGVSFQKQPSNKGTIQVGSQTVMINNKPAARTGDTAMTCNDPSDAPVGKVVVAASTVMIG